MTSGDLPSSGNLTNSNRKMNISMVTNNQDIIKWPESMGSVSMALARPLFKHQPECCKRSRYTLIKESRNV